MKSQTTHCCLSCGADISEKRRDAKYCSGRCRMRYRHRQQKLEIIGKLAETFNALPHHDAQFTGNGFYLVGPDATSGKTRKWDISELTSMSKRELKALKKQKNWQLVIDSLRQLLF